MDARVSVLSPTAQFGLNVFEGIRGYWSDTFNDIVIFRFQDHIDRLRESCRLIGVSCPFSDDELFRGVQEVLNANEFNHDVALRLTVFVGGMQGSWHSCEPVSAFIAPIEKPRRDLTTMRGLSATVSSWRRISDNVLPPRSKVGANYLNGRYAQLDANDAGYDLPIMLNDSGKVGESAGSCVMIVRENEIITPPVTASILESITRASLLELAETLGLKTCVREMDRTEVCLADEVFLCGSAAEILPITKVDRFMIGSGNAGPISKKLHSEYIKLVSGELETFHSYLRPVRNEK